MSSFEPLANDAAGFGFVPDEERPAAGDFVRDGAAPTPEEVEAPETPVPPEVESPVDPAVALQASYDEGFRAGSEALPWREARQLEGAIEALDGAARALVDLERHYLGAHRRLAVELALTVAESLLQRALEADPDAVASRIERAVESVASGDPLCVKLSSADLEALEAGDSPVLARLGQSAVLRLEADAELGRGDFRVEGPRSRVDGRRDELLRRVRAELHAQLEDGEAAP